MTKINFLPILSLHCQETRLWELIKWSPKRKCFDLLSNFLNSFFKEIYRDQFGEFVCGYWGLNGLRLLLETGPPFYVVIRATRLINLSCCCFYHDLAGLLLAPFVGNFWYFRFALFQIIIVLWTIFKDFILFCSLSFSVLLSSLFICFLK